MTGETVLIQELLILGPARPIFAGAVPEELEELIENGQVELGACICNNVEGFIPLRTREERGETDVERIAGTKLGDRPGNPAHPVLPEEGEVLEPDLVAVLR